MPGGLRIQLNPLFTLAIGLLGIVESATAQPAGGDLKKMAGMWYLVSEEFRAHQAPGGDAEARQTTLTVSGDKFIFESRISDSGRAAYTGMAVVDETTRPKQFDWTGNGPKGASLERIGLYELTDSEFRLVYIQRLAKNSNNGDNDAGRPTAFATSEDNNHVVLVFRRKSANASRTKSSPPVNRSAPKKFLPKYVLVFAPVQRIHATLTTEFSFPQINADEWFLFTPQLPELPSQRNVVTVMDPAGRPVKELSDLGRTVLFARLTAEDQSLRKQCTVRLSVRADLVSRQLIPLVPGTKAAVVNDLSPEAAQLALASTGLIDHDSQPFQAWLNQRGFRRGNNENDVDFARRTFQGICTTFKYAFHESLDRSAVSVCQAGQSDCGGLHFLFVATLRANGIPARVLVGRFANPGDKQQPLQIDQVFVAEYGGQHATAEFFGQGVGWIPADITGGIAYNKTAQGMTYFGRDRGDFLTFHIDDNLVLNSPELGNPTVVVMQSPAAWPKGDGSLNDFKRNEVWDVGALR